MVGPLDVTTGIWHIQAYLFLVLIANGKNVKVVEETNASWCQQSFTLEVYTQAKSRAKGEAQHRIIEMMLPDEELAEIRPTYGSAWSLGDDTY